MEEQREEDPQPQMSPEEYLALQKKDIQKKSLWGIAIGGALVALHLLYLFLGYLQFYLLGESGDAVLDIKLLFQSVLFIVGLFLLAAGIYGLIHARRLTLEDIIPSQTAVEFLSAGATIKPIYSYILVGMIVAVTIVQLNVEGLNFEDFGQISGDAAGLVKPLVWDGQWWRIFTAATIHVFFPFHLYFNAQALLGFGSLVEALSNRAHLATVFMLSVAGGGAASLFAMPEVVSVGASGGILGVVGYMLVYGYRRKHQLPPNFLKSIMVNVLFIVGIGIVGYQFIDNMAHVGGLLAGAIYGFIQIPRDKEADPRIVGPVATVAGMISLVAFGAAALLAILRIMDR